jgi:hypothetical protein
LAKRRHFKHITTVLAASFCVSYGAFAQSDSDAYTLENCAAFAMAEMYHFSTHNSLGDMDLAFEESSEGFISAIISSAELDPNDPYTRLTVVQNLIPLMLPIYTDMNTEGPVWQDNKGLKLMRTQCVKIASDHNETNGVYE